MSAEIRRNVILQGDAWQLAKTLPDESINCIVTSPPYFGLRDYGTAQWEGGDAECDHHKIQDAVKAVATSTLGGGKKTTGHLQEGYGALCPRCGARRVDSQFGLESTVEEYVDKLVALFRELRRALRHDGVLFLNLGDSYNGSGGEHKNGGGQSGVGAKDRGRVGIVSGRNVSGLKPKDLIGIPWRVAFALQADGWYLRSEIIWHKKAPMPESVTDRPTKAHEQVFLLTKSPRYHYDADAIAEPIQASTQERYQYGWNGRDDDGSNGARTGSAYKKMKAGATMGEAMGEKATRNRRSVWTLGPESFKGAHFAVMPTKLVEPCILAGCPHKVCAECGAPWERQVERQANYEKRQDRGQPNGVNGQVDSTGWKPTTITDHGFAPTCACGGDTRPGVTLDPFLGSGTVAAVAKDLGRDWVGFELNPDYIELAYKRIDGVQPPLLEVN